jgi:phosphoglycerol transferase MdoB-like AlkP superfamily enzyme
MTRFFWKRFIGVWIIALVSTQLSRCVFYLNLHSYFKAPLADVLNAFAFGTLFDLVSISFLVGVYFIVLPFLRTGWSETLAKWFFLTMLGAINLLNCIDAEFFRFTARRSTSDLFEFAFISDDVFNLAPNLLVHFWYLLVGFLAIMFLSLWAYDRLFQSGTDTSKLWQRLVALVPIALVLVLGIRGGFRPIPLTIVDAGNANNPQLNAITLNTSFTILKTLGKPALPRFSFANDELTALSPVVHPHGSPYFGRLKGQNVVIIIVESLATEYVGSLNGLEVGYTPFVDSLCREALVFENAFANGHRSIEGIPAIVSSIPTLMYEAFSTSRYVANSFTSLAGELGRKGYHTSFYHGGNKNSMNFESFSRNARYDLFYDRDDYPEPEAHYDGIWGISDHYFLNHCVERYNEQKTPFFSSIFTLSSHHPYSLPKEYQNRYPKGTLPIHESIGYADESLRQFFAKASKTSWYANTLFVITADHTSLSDHQQYQTKLGSLRIPIIFFHPNDTILKGVQHQVIQQSDIMPTILGLLGHDEPFFSFGVDAFDKEAPHAAVAFKHDQYQLFMNGHLICSDGKRVTYIYDVTGDPNLKHNLANTSNLQLPIEEGYLRSYISNYSIALNDNRMTFESWMTQGR